jgi:hypothetical protein
MLLGAVMDVSVRIDPTLFVATNPSLASTFLPLARTFILRLPKTSEIIRIGCSIWLIYPLS